MRTILGRFLSGLSVGLAGVLAAGCGQSAGTPAGPAEWPAADAGGAKYLLAREPAGARPVTDVRRSAKDGDEVAVIGRIGGNARPWVEGRAAFLIVDPSVKACTDMEHHSCPTPWDYCHTPREDLVKAMATVKVVDGRGAAVAVDARRLLGLKELQTVVAHGRAKRDDHGNLTVLADGLFVRP
jgi:hypothetical protein